MRELTWLTARGRFTSVNRRSHLLKKLQSLLFTPSGKVREASEDLPSAFQWTDYSTNKTTWRRFCYCHHWVVIPFWVSRLTTVYSFTSIMNEQQRNISEFPNMTSSTRKKIPSVLCLALIVLLIPQVSSSGIFQFRLDYFNNPLSRDQDGNCCSNSSVSSSSSSLSSSSSSDYYSACSGPCNVYFRVCLKHYQNKIDTDTPCTFGEVTTQVLGEDSISNPGYIIPIPFNFSWTVSLSWQLLDPHLALSTLQVSSLLVSSLTRQFSQLCMASSLEDANTPLSPIHSPQPFASSAAIVLRHQLNWEKKAWRVSCASLLANFSGHRRLRQTLDCPLVHYQTILLLNFILIFFCLLALLFLWQKRTPENFVSRSFLREMKLAIPSVGCLLLFLLLFPPFFMHSLAHKVYHLFIFLRVRPSIILFPV